MKVKEPWIAVPCHSRRDSWTGNYSLYQHAVIYLSKFLRNPCPCSQAVALCELGHEQDLEGRHYTLLPKILCLKSSNAFQEVTNIAYEFLSWGWENLKIEFGTWKIASGRVENIGSCSLFSHPVSQYSLLCRYFTFFYFSLLVFWNYSWKRCECSWK